MLAIETALSLFGTRRKVAQTRENRGMRENEGNEGWRPVMPMPWCAITTVMRAVNYEIT